MYSTNNNERDIQQRMLDKFIYEYMLSKNLNDAAEIFKEEANVGENLPVIRIPEGSLRVWWSMYQGTSDYDFFTNNLSAENENNMLTNPSASGGTSTMIMEPFTEMNQPHVAFSSTMTMDPIPMMNQQLTPLEYDSMMFKNPSAGGGTSSGAPWLSTYLNTEHLDAGETNVVLPTAARVTEGGIINTTNAANSSLMDSGYISSHNYICKNNVIPFMEVGSMRPSTRELLCCHFSSDGKFLASAGHEKKIFLWEVDSFNSVSTDEEHDDIITDIRFIPSSWILATSSVDRTVKIWNASKPACSVSTLTGHSQPVVSVDFHPIKSNILCSCDTENEIRLWDYKKSECLDIFKGASKQVRFQPRGAGILAASTGNIINLIDIETKSINQQLEGHIENVRSLCWDPSGKYLASVSEESARIWSTRNEPKCIHSLSFASGNKFESCVFHPTYSMFMVLGCQKSLELWNPILSNKTKTVIAHDGVVLDLADNPDREFIASAGHDQQIKLWK